MSALFPNVRLRLLLHEVGNLALPHSPTRGRPTGTSTCVAPPTRLARHRRPRRFSLPMPFLSCPPHPKKTHVFCFVSTRLFPEFIYLHCHNLKKKNNYYEEFSILDSRAIVRHHGGESRRHHSKTTSFTPLTATEPPSLWATTKPAPLKMWRCRPLSLMMARLTT